MAALAIKIEGLGKKYLLAHQRPNRLLREVLTELNHRLITRLKSPFRPRTVKPNYNEEFWALSDMSLEIREGERVGIIGRNGAGKSTLLKILSRITDPTTGRVSLRGRVASLLEVGTGFHPELTGRENIFLNGAILGMTRNEIKKNFDAIVDFAGVERFLDTPVKRYSSGMYVRLAFAVAAHLETEILMVDEVLAVGDSEFQKKCMGKMDEVSHKQGRTILFISHNMGAISQLCERVVWLESGHLKLDTPEVAAGIKQYLSSTQDSDAAEWTNADGQFKSQFFTPSRFGLYGADGKPVQGVISRADDVHVEIDGAVDLKDPALCVGYALYTDDGTLLYHSYQTDQMGSPYELPVLCGEVKLSAKIPLDILNEGDYRLELIAVLHNRQWLIRPGVASERLRAPRISMRITGPVTASPYRATKQGGPLAISVPWMAR